MKWNKIGLAALLLIGICATGADARVRGPQRLMIFAGSDGILPTGSIGETEIASGAVTVTKIGTGAVTGPKISASAISNSVIAANAVTGDKINNGSISNADLAADCIQKSNLNAEDFGDFTAGSDGTCTLDDGVVTGTKIDSGAVTGPKVAANAISNSVIADDAISKGKLNAEDFGDFTAAADGSCTLDNDVVGPDEMADADHGDVSWSSGAATVDHCAGANLSGNIALGRLTNATENFTGARINGGTLLNNTLASTFTCTSGQGAATAGNSTAVEYGPVTIHHTTINLYVTNTLAQGDHGTGKQIYTFPAGAIYIIGCTLNGTTTSTTTNYADNPNDVFVAAIGTASAADDNALTSTEADIIASTTFDTASRTVFTWDFHAQTKVQTLYDGTTSNAGLYMNTAITTASSTAENTMVFTGQLQIFWINLGDY
jgi:hypothetical protein